MTVFESFSLHFRTFLNTKNSKSNQLKLNDMKTRNSFGVHFNIRSDREKDGRAPVYAVITVNGQKTQCALKEKIALKCWDLNKGMGKLNTAEGKQINTYLEEIRRSLTDCYK